jgi:hypothetical protein
MKIEQIKDKLKSLFKDALEEDNWQYYMGYVDATVHLTPITILEVRKLEKEITPLKENVILGSDVDSEPGEIWNPELEEEVKEFEKILEFEQKTLSELENLPVNISEFEGEPTQ